MLTYSDMIGFQVDNGTTMLQKIKTKDYRMRWVSYYKSFSGPFDLLDKKM